MDIARFDMDIAHFEITMAFLQNLVYFKVCIPLGFSKMVSTGLSVESNCNKDNLDIIFLTKKNILFWEFWSEIRQIHNFKATKMACPKYLIPAYLLENGSSIYATHTEKTFYKLLYVQW